MDAVLPADVAYRAVLHFTTLLAGGLIGYAVAIMPRRRQRPAARRVRPRGG